LTPELAELAFEFVEMNAFPNHIAIIMDGNGRWAQRHRLPRLEGHRAGIKAARRTVEYLAERGLRFLTLFAFSTENWSRPRREVRGLLHLLEEALDRELRNLEARGVRLRHLGKLDGVPRRLQRKIHQALELTADNRGMTLCLAFNYGGRAEILEATRRIVKDGVRPEEISEDLFGRYLYTAGLPEVDLVIRTSGELRLSNFLLWQTAYSEFYFTPTLWPDFGAEDIERALLSFSQRERRFGRLTALESE